MYGLKPVPFELVPFAAALFKRGPFKSRASGLGEGARRV
jgi:hypothetical protein